MIRIGNGALILLLAAAPAAAKPPRAAEDPGEAGYRRVFATDFAHGIGGELWPQGPRADSLTVADSPAGGGPCLRVSLRRDDDYSRVANGVPRAELSLSRAFRFRSGREYRIEWSIFLPSDYRFDAAQPEGLSQIHPGPNKSTPSFGLSLKGARYRVDVGAGSGGGDAGDAGGDRGRWVRWALVYAPDAAGEGKTLLYKDGALVFDGKGRPNAVAGDDAAYFKLGLYKWWWRTKPSDVTERTLYFGDVVIGEKKTEEGG